MASRIIILMMPNARQDILDALGQLMRVSGGGWHNPPVGAT